MLRLSTIRRFALNFALACAVGASASAQGGPPSSLPATPPTSAPQAGNAVAPLTATSAKPDPNRAHKADVRYDSGLISINASNSSLNQILREISRQTGMKISGGVRDERVFGHYGPAPVGDILATLIGGTGTNMVLRQNAANAPEELILTPRGGGPSPPNPNAPGFDDSSDDDRDAQSAAPPKPLGIHVPVTVPGLTPNEGSVPPSIPPPANNVNGSPNNTSPTASTFPVTTSVPTDAIPTPSTTPPATGIVDAPNPPPPGVVVPGATNGVKTPEDIYKQLQQLRAQQQQQQQQQQSTTPPK